MAGINATRSGLVQNVDDAVSDAKLIAFNDDGEACVWFGGYKFNVYDAARDWNKTSNFISSELSETNTSNMDELKRELAVERMESEGFTVIG